MNTPIKLLALTTLLTAGVAGCGETEQLDQPPEMLNVPRAHAEKGPHGGMLIELGNEEFHGELLHNETTGEVAIYLLDASAENSVAIDAQQILINVKFPDRGEQFALTADPADGDPDGVSSRFISTNEALGEALDSEEAQSQLVLTIEGKPFRGKIEHKHDHGHDH